MNSDRRVHKSHAAHNSLSQHPENSSRSVSPISKNNPQNRVIPPYVHYKTCSSNTHSRNVTPPDNTHLTVYTLDSQRAVTCPSCSNCCKLEKELENSQKSLLRLKEKGLANEKHIKQYEGLLKIKENRLVEREKSLNEQMRCLEKQKQRNGFDNSLGASEIKGVASNRSNSNDVRQKNMEFKAVSRRMEILDKRNKATETIGTSLAEEIKKSEQLLLIIRLKEEQLALKDKEFLQKQKILTKDADKCKKIEAEVKKQSESFAIKEKELIEKEESLKELEKKLIAKETYLEEEKDTFKLQKKNFEQETLKLKESYETLSKEFEHLKTMSESRISTENLQKASPEKTDMYVEPFDELSFGRMVYTDSDKNSAKFSMNESLKGSENQSIIGERFSISPFNFATDPENPNKSTYISRDSRDEVPKISIIDQIRSRFEQKSLEHQHQIKIKDYFYSQEIEKLQLQTQNLQSSIEKLTEENFSLKNKLEKCKAKKNLLKKDKGFDRLDQIIEDLQDKLKIVTQREAEIGGIRQNLCGRQEMVFNDAQSLKEFFEDVLRDKAELGEEKESFFAQKAALMEVERMQKERMELIGEKEKELEKLKEELVFKKRILVAKFSKLPAKMFQRGHTLMEDTLDDSMIMNR